MASYSPVSIQHVNITVKPGTLHLSEEFYGEVLGMHNDPVPQVNKDVLQWFRIGDGPQQIHVAFERQPNAPEPFPLSSRHPCFALASPEALLELQKRIFKHMGEKGEAAAMECDEPGQENSGPKAVEYPTRFFARDFAGNKLEFSVPHSH